MDDNNKLYLDAKGLQYFYEKLCHEILNNKIDNPPNDGKLYIRKDGEWTELPKSEKINPIDNNDIDSIFV